MKISFILPAYKVEHYISKCLHSCINQDIPKEEYEIIVIDDGSPDNTKIIVEDYIQRYNNIRLITQTNKGVSAARNEGLKHAKGKYIWFIDPDDFIQDNCIRKILRVLENNELDILWIKWKRFDENGIVLPPFKDERKSEDTRVMNGMDFLENVLKNCAFIWAFIIKKEFLLKNNLFFNDQIICTEDTEFISRVLVKAQRVKFMKENLYNYIWRNNNATNSQSLKKFNSLLSSLSSNLELSKKYPNCLYFKEVTTSLIIVIIRTISTPKYKDEREVFFTYIKQNRINKIYYNGIGIRKVMTIIYNISPRLCVLISTLLKNNKKY